MGIMGLGPIIAPGIIPPIIPPIIPGIIPGIGIRCAAASICCCWERKMRAIAICFASSILPSGPDSVNIRAGQDGLLRMATLTPVVVLTMPRSILRMAP